MTTTAPEPVPMSTLLTALGREATARVRRAMRPLDLGAQQYQVLRQLQVLGEASQAELADALGIDRSNLVATAADLSDRGVVERTRDASDRRRYVLRPSRSGEQLLRRTESAIATAEHDLLAPLNDQQREQLYTLLRQLADGVELCPAVDAEQLAGIRTR